MNFSSFFKECHDSWVKAFLGPEGAPAEFWEMLSGTSFVRKHPHLPRRLWGKILPLGMHGDAGAYSESDSVYALNWNSLLGTGSTIRTRFLFSVVRKSDMVPETIDTLLEVMAWSFNVLLSGITPDTDWLDRPLEGGGEWLANGYRGCLAQCRGDWAFYKEIFRFPAWNEAESMCWMCRAGSRDPRLSFTDFSATAGWRSTRWIHERYIEDRRARNLIVPVFLAKVAGFRLENIMIDVLHTIDQGVASHIIGNVFGYFALCELALVAGFKKIV